MENKKNAISIVEAIVIILIVTMGLIGVYNIYTRSIKTVTNMGNKIEATQIAREGIEAVMNIRDTNWLLFSSNKKDCWKTLNYDESCVLAGDSFTGNILDSYYRIFKDSNGRWVLEEAETTSSGTLPYQNYSNDYREFFKVSVDEKGLYTQSGGTALPQNFTRELKITSTGANVGDISATGAIIVNSKVMWVDSSSSNPQNVELEVVLTNYEK